MGSLTLVKFIAVTLFNPILVLGLQRGYFYQNGVEFCQKVIGAGLNLFWPLNFVLGFTRMSLQFLQTSWSRLILVTICVWVEDDLPATGAVGSGASSYCGSQCAAVHVNAVARNVDRNEIYEDFSSVLASVRQTQYYPMFSNFVTRVIVTSPSRTPRDCCNW